jgi:hypothetical protein
MSTSSASPPILSIVVASNGAPGSVEECLATLEGQLDGTEVLVCAPEVSSESVRRRFPFARFLEREGALVPELWRDGIDAASGEAVALTISPMRLAPDWVATARSLVSEAEVAAGAIDPGEGLRVRDAAEYFCRYARDMLPFEPHECLDLPGDNAVYAIAALARTRDDYRDGFWEAEVNRVLHQQGTRLLHTPALVAFQGRSAGIGAFTRQRLRHGRLFGHQRGARFGSARNLAGAIAAPLVPFVMTFRVAREVSRRRRHRLKLVAAMPLVFYFNVVWAVAEARGHLEMLTRR